MSPPQQQQLDTIFEDDDGAVTDRCLQLMLLKRKRRQGRQLTIGMRSRVAAAKMKSATRPTKMPRYYRALSTIYEEEEEGEGEHVFKGWPKTKAYAYEFPSLAIQKVTGHGEACAYCFRQFLHRYDLSKSPIYLINCGHIVCGQCVLHRSQAMLPNLSPLTRNRAPFVACNEKMACPACNVEFTWQELYHFYT